MSDVREEAALYVEEALGALRFLLWTWHEPATVPDDQAGERQLQLDMKTKASFIDEFVGIAPWRSTSGNGMPRKLQRRRTSVSRPVSARTARPKVEGQNLSEKPRGSARPLALKTGKRLPGEVAAPNLDAISHLEADLGC